MSEQPLGTTLAVQPRPVIDLDILGPHTLEEDCAIYLAFKQKRLTASSQRGYLDTLRRFAGYFHDHELADFEPPRGSALIEQFLTISWGNKAPRTYNKHFSVLSDFFKWQVIRGKLNRDPMAALEKAQPRAVHRTTFTDEQCALILASNPAPRDQIALRLLLFYGLRKGALRNVKVEHFDTQTRRLVIFTKGEKIHYLPITDDTIWQLLQELGEPGDHYLIPKQILRRRVSPNRAELQTISDLLGDLNVTVDATTDASCASEIRGLGQLVEAAFAELSLAAEAASVQVRRFPAEKIGEHGTHDWWYRCLGRAGIVAKGVTSGQRLHKARHTAGQRILDATGNLKAAQALLCHANISTTGNAYTAWEIDQLAGSLREAIPSDAMQADLLAKARVGHA